MKRLDVVLYDVYFPIWLHLLVPAVLMRVLAINYVVNAVVVRLTLGRLSMPRPLKTILGYSVPATVLGLAADLAGLAVFEALFPERYAPGAASSLHPGLFILIAVAGLLVAVVNYLLSGPLLGLRGQHRLIIAAAMGLITAPWLVLLDRSVGLVGAAWKLAQGLGILP